MKITAREMNRIAGIIDRVVGELDVRAAAAEQRHLVRDEAARVIEQLADARTKAAERLRDSLARLIQLMDAPEPVETAGKPRSARSWQTLMKAFAALLGGVAFALPAAAAPTVGETFTHPFYPGKTLTWEVVEAEGYVAVDQDGMNYSFLAIPAIGSQLAYDYVGDQWQTATVVGYQTASGAFTTSIVQGADGLFYDAVTSELITHASTGTVDMGVPTVERNVSLTAASGGGTQVEYQNPTTSSANQIQVIRKGNSGKNGNNAVLFVPAASGKAGQNGPAIDQDFSINTDIDVVANRSPAVHVASIGGNGGDGGDAYLSVVGGGKKGGAGGSGGHVETTISGSGVVTTNGTASHGVVIQSAAGVGGEGGSNFVSTGGTGSGGIAANGGNVDATVDVEIRTIGNESHGVLIQSLGGGAGKGGSSYGLFGYATNGGWGGNGGNIVATVNNTIRTEGLSSHGVVVQSIGGQGGDGGGAGGIVAFGGDGGIGGNGGTVDLTLNGNVTTLGAGSYGVVVQSIGGSGGNGGAAGGLVALGSKGSEGGAGSTVDFTMGAGSSITTDGLGSFGAVVQSIGGGGGNAGASGGLVSVGGRGGAGSHGGAVTTDLAGDILTKKDGSVGLVAQSIGGGGGTGGINVTGAVSRTGSPIALGIGGSGGSGGDAGTVTVARGYEVDGTATGGLIYTHGDGTSGLVAQSIGGGGGNAGYNLVLGLKPTGSGQGGSEVGMLMNIGGSGAGAGSADKVDVRHDGTIVTQGNLADGLVAQSIGGGGGSGTFNLALGVFKDARAAMTLTVGGATGAAGRAESVNVHHRGDIFTHGELARGIVAQSIGGGGGNAGTDFGLGILAKAGLTVALGREGGTGGEGSTVDVDVDGRIVTQGELSDGILAQSIGGGGGTSGAIAVSGSFKTPEDESMGGSISIGLEGGQGAESDDVSVRFAGELYTSGDDARGIFAQSIGGGGGVGGGASATQFMATGSANMAIGGTGGLGAIAGNIDIDNLGLIRTSGEGSDGILAQSIGGGGGMGGSTRVIGFQIAASKGTTQNTAVFAVGGSGGTGADAGQIDIANSGKIITDGLNANGIRAQSIGGGGGIGGAVYAMRVQGPGDNNSVELMIGGAGGTGGNGNLVDVANTGLIYTLGDNAAGIAATSIGGGGGDAGTVLSLTLDGAVGSRSNRLVTTIGGSGGTGGLGGAVVVSNLAVDDEEHSGTIITEGLGSHGIMAQSIGGGGGNGSTVLNVQAGLSSADSVIGGLAIGGTGGAGNLAGTVDVENAGLVYTSGDNAHGILAQSIGGGGGNGGLSIVGNLLINPSPTAPVVSLGGFGGDGGNGNRVTVDNSGSILTTGANAHGIVAQSIGGGGGNANVGLSAGTDPLSALASNALSFALGNVGGGNGGIGGEVVVNHSGDITVTGDGSVAIKAESINGGGGTLALDIYGLIGLPGMPYVDIVGIKVPAEPAIVARLGAEGSTSMNAGKVTVNTTGTINAGGDRTVADFAQAIGGGGGTLNLNVELAEFSHMADAQATGFNVMLGGINGAQNAAADIDSQHDGAMVAAGNMATGILAQAIGGGGGRGVINMVALDAAAIARGAVTLGAVDTTDETGGAVERDQTGAVLTGGDYSTASVLQSIGGGGGSVVANLDGDNDGVDLRLGAQGGTGADARNVSGDYAGGVQTFGAYASGLVLQSIGAGGGEIRVAGAADAPVVLGGSGNVNGDAGNVSLNHHGMILTEGTGAHGLVLQSIGGGGGAVFGNINGPVTLSSTNTGNGGDITLTQDQLIVARGANAFGVIAQSLGGGGGWVDGQFAGSAGGQGSGGNVSLSFAQGIYALANNSVAVFAQSEGGDGAGNISLDLHGAVRGGDGEGAAVRLAGGQNNRITSDVMLSSVSGWAIQGGTGNDRVINNGQVFGNLDLGAGDNRFINRAGASFMAFDTIRLREGEPTLSARSFVPTAMVIEGAEATFTNEGVFRMGLDAAGWPIDLAAGETFGNWDDLAAKQDNVYYGARAITTVELDGNFVQTASGKSVFDVAFGDYASDRVNLTGDAHVDGQIAINLMWLEDAEAVTLFATEGTGSVGDVQIDGTMALNFSLKGDDAGVHLLVESDFGQTFLRPNEERLGGHMDSALQTGGAAGLGRLMAALGNMVAGQEDLYQAIFTDLNPEGHVAAMQTQYYGATQFADRMFGCGLGRETALDRCVWGVGSTTAFDQEETGEYWGATSRIFNARVGMEQRLNADWALSLAAGYNSLQRQQTVRMNTQGDGFDVGAGLIRQGAKGTDLRLTATGGWQWLESQRYGYVFDTMVGHSKGQNGYLQLGAELGHTVRAGEFFLRPAVGVMGTALINGDYAERGWDGLGARVEGDTQYIGAIEPKVTTGWTFDPAQGVNAALSLTAGRVHRSEDGISLPIRLMGASTASDAADITTPLDRAAWKLGFEAKIRTDSGVTFQAGYDGQLGDKADVHTASVSVRWSF
ncbi:autotransporter outer membrane beta-barrel domain-containing protein [Brevundimonas sp. UBA5713]|uniref:autotransporter outer membrane beta-barrel domain-containing protein n=1 Tax=Brevundimonas sp. UBA5713 TaxID=1946130 RepID=UPI0025BDCB02|nr:autotransporter outer membrane beta-barrel domain-containing protein [Brevundimonas sp. UBA5713]